MIDETVRVAKEFLESHPEEVKKVSKLSALRVGKAGRELIAKFLGWTESRVGYSLERLGLTERKVLDKKAVESMPTDKAARTFTDVVKEHKLDLPTQQLDH